MSEEAAKRNRDVVFDSLGDFGLWQCLVLILIAISKFPVGFHQLSTVFLAPPVDVYCVNPGPEYDACDPSCLEVEYNRTIFEQTIIMEWDLICDKMNYANYGQTIFMFGILVGNVGFGIWADKQGRRIPLLFAVVLQLTAGCLAAISPWFWSFVFFRFLSAVATGGKMLTTFCLIMEIIGPSRREVMAGIVFQLPFNAGHLLLAVIAYFIRHFRWYQFTLSIFSAVLLSYFCLLPESPRWLMLAGRLDESVHILEKAARLNKKPTEDIRAKVEEFARIRATKAEVKKGDVFDLLRTPNLRRNTLCIFFNWFTWGFNYFGVSQYVGVLSGNIFVNVAISAIFGVPGVILSAPACKYLGRKPTLAIANLCIAGSMIVFMWIPEEMETLRVILSSLAVFGSALSFPTCYLYAGEIFPTAGRNSGIGIASMLARIGAMSAAQAMGLAARAKWLPTACFALTGGIAFFLTLMLPETLGEPLPETFEEAEEFGKR